MRQIFRDFFIYIFSAIITPNSFVIFSKLILDKTKTIKFFLKDLITFHNICPHDMSTINNKSNK